MPDNNFWRKAISQSTQIFRIMNIGEDWSGMVADLLALHHTVYVHTPHNYRNKTR